MILEHVELKNYRCFESLSIPLDPHLNVFVGGNGSGKTAILRAITICLAPVISRLPLQKKEALPKLTTPDIQLAGPDRNAPYTRISARAVGVGDGPVEWDRLRLRDESKQTKQQSPADSHGLRQLHAALDHITSTHNAGQPYDVPVFAYYGTNRAVDVPHYRLSPKPVPSSFRRFASLEGALAAKADFRRAVGWFDQYETRELRSQREAEGTQNGAELQAVRSAIIQMIPGVANPRIDSQTGRFAVDLRDPSGRDVKLHLDQLSDGYQVMLGIVMDFALRMAIANPRGGQNVLSQQAILLIDEVDLHLHPSWQQKVIPDLRRTFPNTQLILCSHSPQVATTVPSHSLRILRGSRLYAAPDGTEGAEAQRLLEDVFGVEPRPHVDTAEKLKRYLKLVDGRQWDSAEAVQLRRELDEWSQGQEPDLVAADLRIDNMRWEAAQ